MIRLILSLALLTPTVQVDVVRSYHSSPLEVRRRLQADFAKGRPTDERIRKLVEHTGDHSFDSLRIQRQEVRQAIRLQHLGLAQWKKQNYEAAIFHYQKALAACSAGDAHSESLFSLYYLAEIMAEQGLNRQALTYLNQAFLTLDSDRNPFLAALLNESKGYSLWFLDYLPASIECFARAMHYWQTIGFDSGIVGSWNNLACLYEQMRLSRQADRCYQEALASRTQLILPEVGFQVHRNYAVFLKNRGNVSSALLHLEQCRKFKSVAPDEFKLAEAEIQEREDLIHSVRSTQPIIQIEKELLLGEFYLRRGEKPKSRDCFRKALELSRSNSLHIYTRKATLRLGELLELEGRWQQAMVLYSDAYQQEQLLLQVETLFPYRRIISPLFDGWIRCQIRLHKQGQARQAIHRFTQLRKFKAHQLLKLLPHFERHPDKLEQFSKLICAGNRSLPEYPSLEYELQPRPQNYTAVEMWPLENEILVWIDNPSQTHFTIIQLEEDVQALVESTVSLFHSAQTLLPRPIPHRSLDQLYSALFQPIERFIRTRRVLIIAHKRLQSIPFELVASTDRPDSSAKYIFSYLPAVENNPTPNNPILPDPLLFMPETFRKRSGAQNEERFLRRVFPQLRVIRHLRTEDPLIARWIHASTHFDLNAEFWPVSTLENNGEKLMMMDFFRRRIKCELLSFGVCDIANSHSFDSPYWMGLAELLLSAGARSLVLSRWQLDEAASQIFIDFYRLCLNGTSMDEALGLARQRFLRNSVKRSEFSASGAHPYFWAGIIYIGQPGKRLYPPKTALDPLPPVLALAGITVLTLSGLIYLMRFSALQRSSTRNRRPKAAHRNAGSHSALHG